MCRRIGFIVMKYRNYKSLSPIVYIPLKLIHLKTKHLNLHNHLRHTISVLVLRLRICICANVINIDGILTL